MQLMGEPETTLDIEINMSTLENMQNNQTDDLKTVNLDIENLQEKKVNGNERHLDLNRDSKCDKNEKVVNEIHDTSADVPMNISNNEVQLSNENFVEKNGVINEKSQSGINGLDSDQNDVMDIDESEETLEEDYLEDDIISIIEEPVKEVTPENIGTEEVIFERHVSMKEEVVDDKKEHVTSMEVTIADEVKDEEEIKVKPQSNSEQCTKDVELESPKQENYTDDVITESQVPNPIQGEKETHMSIQEEKDYLRISEITDSVNAQNESLILSTSNDIDKMDIIDESDSSQVPIDQVNEREPLSTAENNEAVNTTENNKVVNIAKNNEPVNTAENNETENTAENNEAVNTTGSNDAVNTTENNKAVNTAENDEEINTAENNEAINTAEKNEAVNTTENNDLVNSAENNEAVSTTENNEVVNAAENNEAVNTTENNEVVNAEGNNEALNNEKNERVIITAGNNEAVNTAENNVALNAAENNEAENNVALNAAENYDTLKTSENNNAINTAGNNETLNSEKNETVRTAENNESENIEKTEPVSTAENNETGDTTVDNEAVNIEEKIETEGFILEKNHSPACEKNIVSLIEESKDDIRIVEFKSTLHIIEDENSKEKENSIQSINIMDTEIDKETEITPRTDIPVSPLSEVHDIEIIEDQNKDQDETQTESHTEVNETKNMIKPMEVVNTEQTSETNTSSINTPIDNSAMDVEKVTKDTTIAEVPNGSNKDDTDVNSSIPVTTTTVNIIDKPIICKLSNTLDILSDDDEDLPLLNLEKAKSPMVDTPKPLEDANNKCIDLEDDDDIMVIDEDTDKTETKSPEDTEVNKETAAQPDTDSGIPEKIRQETIDLFESLDKEETTTPSDADKNLNMEIDISEKTPEPKIDNNVPPPPLIPDNFVKTAKKKLSDMTRNDLEEFCILKIVESIVDRSSLNDIQSKLRSMTQGLEEYKKKVMMLSRQNRDLQLVLKSVQEEQKKSNGTTPIAPLKITRSVGMQIYMEKVIPRKKGQPPNVNNKNSNNIQNKNAMTPSIRPQKQVSQPQNIPVPRLVPASNTALKTPNTVPQITSTNTTPVKNNTPNGIIKTPTPAISAVRAEKRQHNKVSSSMTVDLTDDEPPTKISSGPRTSPIPPVRLVPPQNLMGPQRHPFTANVNSPRKVYIPISGPQNQALRPGQTIMLKTVSASGIRPRPPLIARGDPNAARMNRIALRHPAPLPCAMKQYQPPNWKSLPPPPDLKLTKVENGIVISWSMDGVPEDSYEEIASYQLYAYQETTQPPSTSLWKKIGDVKALPLPMACTLTQFMAGFKYYFAVRGVDIRSRFGPFSLPGSILLLNKNV